MGVSRQRLPPRLSIESHVTLVTRCERPSYAYDVPRGYSGTPCAYKCGGGKIANVPNNIH
eukprot:4411111-Prymnesium_polylepis.1